MRKTLFLPALILCFFFCVTYLSAHEINSHILKIDESGFSPASITIKQGDAIDFQNTGKLPHWPASDIHPTHQIYPQFDPKQPVDPGKSWSFTFERAGVFRCHDHLNADHTCQITVQVDNDFVSKTSSTTAPSIGERLWSFIEKGKALLYRGYFSLNPKVRQDKLDSLKLFELTRIPNSSSLGQKQTERELPFWLQVFGAKTIMQKLLDESGGGSALDCHQEAHTIGRVAYEVFGADAFKEGNSSCHSGFYHGAMEGFLKEKGTFNLTANLKKLCNSFPTSFGNFECLHGVGHGIMAYENYNLPLAIGVCRSLGSSYETSSCYGGLFMEDIITAQGKGTIPGHETKWVSNDPHFPCNKIDQSDYPLLYECYQMQTSWMLTLFNWDFDKIIPECLKARPDLVPVCFKSLGRDIAGYTLRTPDKIIRLCDKVPRSKDYHDQCLIGAENVLVEFWGEGLQNQATELCKDLSSLQDKGVCYRLLASRLQDVFNQRNQRLRICGGFENSYQYLCQNL